MNTNAIQGNIDINFQPKPTTPSTNPSRRTTNRPAPHTGGTKPDPKMTSEVFLRHRNQAEEQQHDDPHKLIKKDETPVRIIALGGLEEIGSNMMLLEYKNDIIIVDAGMMFASSQMHGVDYIIPDVSYLTKKKKNIRGILLTHGHLDHIGALRHILPDLGFPLLYTTPLTLGLVRKLVDEKTNKSIKYQLVDPDVDIIKLGCFTIEFFRVNHNIPESMGLAIHTPKGLVVNTGDFKIDHTPAIDKPADFGKISRIGQEGVRLMMGESTNATKPGHTISERVIGENLDKIIKECKQRMIVSTFASNVGRMIQIIESAVRYNKTVFLAGRSMENNTRLCQELGYITVPKQMIRPLTSEVEQFPDDRVLILCTGSQGEENSALVRMSQGLFKDFALKPGDVVLLSTHTIPGNEKLVIEMTNDLIKKGIEIVNDNSLDIHSSGHGYQEDIKTMISMLKPTYYAPIHGEPYMRHANKKIGLLMGIPEHRILLPENGQPIEIYENVLITGDKKIKLDTVMIDGKGQGHLSGEYVMKARGIMAEDGVVALIFKVDTATKELVGNIQIESRGFVYSSEVKTIHTQIVEYVRGQYNENMKKKIDIKDNLKNIKEDLGNFIMKIIGRVPMIMPMFVYINRDLKDELPQDDAIVGMTLEEQGYTD